MGRAFEYRRASKEKRWDTMSKMYPKLQRLITLAAKDGGPDPNANGKLRAAIANARAQNLPKDNIENAIKRASGADAEDYSEVDYEGKGPHGVLLYIETATDNINRTIANLKTYFHKLGGEIVQNGSLTFLFDRKTVIEFPVPEGKDLEEIELELIDHGLEEMEVNEGTVYLYGDYTAFGSLTTAVEKLGIEATKAKLQRIANSPVEFTDEQIEDIERLIDRIEDDDDVQEVYTNIA